MDSSAATHHPELHVGEVFFINATTAEFAAMPWSTKRRGQVAYDGQRQKLPDQHDWFPVFVAERELREKGLHLADMRRRWRTVRCGLEA